uniref:Nexin_C domain-containing protein n=1 Tax=Mesocestoides corti TaxID=53468 RepID=A0A5K3FYP2_MESCO
GQVLRLVDRLITQAPTRVCTHLFSIIESVAFTPISRQNETITDKQSHQPLPSQTRKLFTSSLRPCPERTPDTTSVI